MGNDVNSTTVTMKPRRPVFLEFGARRDPNKSSSGPVKTVAIGNVQHNFKIHNYL